MTEPALIQAVLLEDDDLDAELLRERLLADGLRIGIRRARDRAEFERELERGQMDIILSDFSLPGYDGLSALDAARVQAAEVPFIFVSGAIGEERAIETLRRGATDYVLKDRLERLTPAVMRALDAADERRKRRAAEADRDRLLVSERAARESAENANRMKDEFLAIVSHELRTPLNAILGWATLLASSAATPRMLEKGLATIERNAHAQSRLIEDILDISRVVTGNLQLRKANVPVASFVRAAVESVRPSADAKAITISVDVGDVGSAFGDSDRLQQIVGNLLSNAVKFTPQGGKVSVAARRSAETVDITVEDSGAGIEPAFLPHVFERFRQGDVGATRRHGGLGLGLAIVRYLVELHGGTASASSDGINRGSRFLVRIPLGEVRDVGAASSPAPPAVAGDAGPPSLDGVHALVVDDEFDTRELVAYVLRASGARVTIASSVGEALERFAEVRPTVIISDIGMPRVDGYAFVKRVRAMPPESGGLIPAIALTAFARDLDRDQAKAAGYQRHLAKPVAPAALVATVAELALARS